MIFLFLTGGVSHVDTFDPKPKLAADVGKEVKLDHPEIQNRPGYERIFLKRPQWEFAKHGQSGTEVSDALPAYCRLRGRYRARAVDAHRSFESLQRHAGDAHRVVRVRPAEHRFLGQLRAGDRESQSALVRDDRAGADVCGLAGLRQRFSARRASRDAGRAGGRAGGQHRAARAASSGRSWSWRRSRK